MAKSTEIESEEVDTAEGNRREEKKKTSVEKWGFDTIKAGFIFIPSVLARYQHRLGLSSTDFNVLVQLIDHWWEPTSKIFPSKDTLAKRMNVSGSTIQRSIARLEKAGLVKRENRYGGVKQQMSNVYHLDGLVAKLAEIAAEDLQAKEEREKSDEERKRRRRPPQRKAS